MAAIRDLIIRRNNVLNLTTSRDQLLESLIVSGRSLDVHFHHHVRRGRGRALAWNGTVWIRRASWFDALMFLDQNLLRFWRPSTVIFAPQIEGWDGALIDPEPLVDRAVTRGLHCTVLITQNNQYHNLGHFRNYCRRFVRLMEVQQQLSEAEIDYQISMDSFPSFEAMQIASLDELCELHSLALRGNWQAAQIRISGHNITPLEREIIHSHARDLGMANKLSLISQLGGFVDSDRFGVSFLDAYWWCQLLGCLLVVPASWTLIGDVIACQAPSDLSASPSPQSPNHNPAQSQVPSPPLSDAPTCTLTILFALSLAAARTILIPLLKFGSQFGPSIASTADPLFFPVSLDSGRSGRRPWLPSATE
ncbi:hypothetical protein M0R45_007590 [Rubus argutus]|uniref:Uncharacterized protein n=1 Tax=Rubus argutus TaxID=59490 RepID=A0AAW1XZH1_RUBAR